MPLHLPITDGVVTIRAPHPDDTAALVAGRDVVTRRFLGEGDPDPRPTAVIEVAGRVVGWVDHDTDADHFWLEPGECNLGYQLAADHRGHGHATRAVRLLLHHLALAGRHRVATLLIDPANHRSRALATRLGTTRMPDLDGNPYFKLLIPPLVYGDGTVTIRRRRVDDLDADLQAKDLEQQRWLWSGADRRRWRSMSEAARRAHAKRGLADDVSSWGHGPRWRFAVDTEASPYVAFIDVDLANPHAPPGEANISYSTHPAHRGRGHASRAVGLVERFLADHTGARSLYLSAAEANGASLQVIEHQGARPIDTWEDDEGRTVIRHHRPIRR